MEEELKILQVKDWEKKRRRKIVEKLKVHTVL